MPSKSPAQARLMRAAAHTSGGYGGVPRKVGKDFVAADRRAGGSPKSPDEHMAKRARHMPQKDVGAEFGRSQSTVSRVLAKGYVSKGKASD